MIGLREEIRVWFADNDTKFAELSGNVKVIDQKLASLDDRVKKQDGKIWTLVTIILGAASTRLLSSDTQSVNSSIEPTGRGRLCSGRYISDLQGDN